MVVLVVHGGSRPDLPGRPVQRFPGSQVGPVTAAVANVLRTLRPAMVVSAPAAGADLIVLDEAQRLDIPVGVVLPIDADRFVEQSVDDVGVEWTERFGLVMDRVASDSASSVVELGLDPESDWFRPANDELLAVCRRLAGERPVAALTIRPLVGEEPPSVTDHLADAALRAGLVVMTLDPRPGWTSGAGSRLTVGSAQS